jgi:YVTN family beta-propeller protein
MRYLYAGLLVIGLAGCGAPAQHPAVAPVPSPTHTAPASPTPAVTRRPGVVVIDVGISPCASVPAPNGMWLTNYSDDTISRIDPTTNTVGATYPVGPRPCGIVYSGGKIWVGLTAGQELDSFNPGTGRPIDQIRTEGPVYDVQERGDTIWYDDWTAGHVLRADARTGRETAKIDVGGSVYGVAITPEGIWATDVVDKVVVRIDPGTNRVVARIKTGAITPFTFAYTPGAVWVSGNPGAVLRIDPVANRVVKTIKFGTMTQAAGDPDALGGYVYVPDANAGEIAKIDPKTNAYVVADVGPGFSVAQAGFGSMWDCDYRGTQIARLDPVAAFRR